MGNNFLGSFIWRRLGHYFFYESFIFNRFCGHLGGYSSAKISAYFCYFIIGDYFKRTLPSPILHLCRFGANWRIFCNLQRSDFHKFWQRHNHDGGFFIVSRFFLGFINYLWKIFFEKYKLRTAFGPAVWFYYNHYAHSRSKIFFNLTIN